MDQALAIAQSGLVAQHKSIEIISNNLANSNTPSYKKSRAVFEELPYQVITQPGADTTQETKSPNGLVMGTGTKLIGNAKIYSDGDQLQTGRPLDIAISGRGFFQVQLPNGGGTAYTRAGSLSTNEQGQLVTPGGYILQPPISLPQGYTNLTIGQDGTVSVIEPGSNNSQQIGQIQLADFVNPDGLQPMGQNLYLETTSSGNATLGNADANGYGMIIQDTLEGSNVNVVEEMVNLIEAQRTFEVTSKSVSAVDEMMSTLTKAT
jgi:flagellar basal-body rod protein FlgG